MFAQIDQQVKNLEEFEASISAIFDSSKAVLKDLEEYQSDDKLNVLEDLKLNFEKFANLQKEVSGFRDSIAAVKTQVLAEDSTVTDANVLSVIESNLSDRIANSTIQPSQAETLSEFDRLINSVKASQPAPVEEEEEEITVTGQIGPTLDPITRKSIVNPVKNIVCGHFYEKSTISIYLNSSKIRKCPYGGCANRELRMADIVDAKLV